jgi:hypothetical protein
MKASTAALRCGAVALTIAVIVTNIITPLDARTVDPTWSIVSALIAAAIGAGLTARRNRNPRSWSR